jgi:DNA-binding response OmpR family regulator
MQRILLAEADDHTLSARGDQLLLDGYEPIAARSAAHTRHLLAREQPEALILGPLDSRAHSLALLRALRAGEIPDGDARLPVLSIGADNDHDAVRHYQAGADIALPSAASPLLIKQGLEALTARLVGEHQRTRRLRVGGLQIDCDARIARIGDTPIKLTRLEFDLLQTLASQPRQVFTRAQLYKEIWGYDEPTKAMTRAVDAQAFRLRQQLRDHGAEGLVHTIRGVGYRLGR